VKRNRVKDCVNETGYIQRKSSQRHQEHWATFWVMVYVCTVKTPSDHFIHLWNFSKVSFVFKTNLLFIYRFAFFRHFMEVESHSLWSFVTSYFSLSLTFSRFICVIACISISSYFVECSLWGSTTSSYGHWCAVISWLWWMTLLWTPMHTVLCRHKFIFLEYTPGCGTAESWVLFSLLRKCYTVLESSCAPPIPVCNGSSLSTPFLIPIIICPFYDSHPSGCGDLFWDNVHFSVLWPVWITVVSHEGYAIKISQNQKPLWLVSPWAKIHYKCNSD
jgi:hypothetical protein